MKSTTMIRAIRIGLLEVFAILTVAALFYGIRHYQNGVCGNQMSEAISIAGNLARSDAPASTLVFIINLLLDVPFHLMTGTLVAGVLTVFRTRWFSGICLFGFIVAELSWLSVHDYGNHWIAASRVLALSIALICCVVASRRFYRCQDVPPAAGQNPASRSKTGLVANESQS